MSERSLTFLWESRRMLIHAIPPDRIYYKVGSEDLLMDTTPGKIRVYWHNDQRFKAPQYVDTRSDNVNPGNIWSDYEGRWQRDLSSVSNAHVRPDKIEIMGDVVDPRFIGAVVILRIAQSQKIITREQFATLFQFVLKTQKIELDATMMDSLLNGSQMTEFMQEIVDANKQ